jgi:hypothetical protein
MNGYVICAKEPGADDDSTCANVDDGEDVDGDGEYMDSVWGPALEFVNGSADALYDMLVSASAEHTDRSHGSSGDRMLTVRALVSWSYLRDLQSSGMLPPRAIPDALTTLGLDPLSLEIASGSRSAGTSSVTRNEFIHFLSIVDDAWIMSQGEEGDDKEGEGKGQEGGELEEEASLEEGCAAEPEEQEEDADDSESEDEGVGDDLEMDLRRAFDALRGPSVLLPVSVLAGWEHLHALALATYPPGKGEEGTENGRDKYGGRALQKALKEAESKYKVGMNAVQFLSFMYDVMGREYAPAPTSTDDAPGFDGLTPPGSKEGTHTVTGDPSEWTQANFQREAKEVFKQLCSQHGVAAGPDGEALLPAEALLQWDYITFLKDYANVSHDAILQALDVAVEMPSNATTTSSPRVTSHSPGAPRSVTEAQFLAFMRQLDEEAFHRLGGGEPGGGDLEVDGKELYDELRGGDGNEPLRLSQLMDWEFLTDVVREGELTKAELDAMLRECGILPASPLNGKAGVKKGAMGRKTGGKRADHANIDSDSVVSEDQFMQLLAALDMRLGGGGGGAQDAKRELLDSAGGEGIGFPYEEYYNSDEMEQYYSDAFAGLRGPTNRGLRVDQLKTWDFLQDMLAHTELTEAIVDGVVAEVLGEPSISDKSELSLAQFLSVVRKLEAIIGLNSGSKRPPRRDTLFHQDIGKGKQQGRSAPASDQPTSITTNTSSSTSGDNRMSGALREVYVSLGGSVSPQGGGSRGGSDLLSVDALINWDQLRAVLDSGEVSIPQVEDALRAAGCFDSSSLSFEQFVVFFRHIDGIIAAREASSTSPGSSTTTNSSSSSGDRGERGGGSVPKKSKTTASAKAGPRPNPSINSKNKYNSNSGGVGGASRPSSPSSKAGPAKRSPRATPAHKRSASPKASPKQSPKTTPKAKPSSKAAPKAPPNTNLRGLSGVGRYRGGAEGEGYFVASGPRRAIGEVNSDVYGGMGGPRRPEGEQEGEDGDDGVDWASPELAEAAEATDGEGPASDAELDEMFLELSRGADRVSVEALRAWGDVQELIAQDPEMRDVVESIIDSMEADDTGLTRTQFGEFVRLLDSVIVDGLGGEDLIPDELYGAEEDDYGRADAEDSETEEEEGGMEEEEE